LSHPAQRSDGLAAVLDQVCSRVGLSASGAVPMRIGTNALFRLPVHAIVVRIGLDRDAFRSAETEIRVARWLAGRGIAACRPAPGIVQPVIVDGHPVTFWQWIEADGSRAGPARLGRTLQSLHALGEQGIELEPFDPLASVEAFVRGPLAVDPASAFLRDQCSILADAFRELTFELPAGPIHGDAHVGNLMGSAGHAVLIDLETFATGPREWDLVPTAVQHDRFGLSLDAYRSFVMAYGVDIRSWAGYPILRRIRELAITAWVGAHARQNEAASTEFRRRVDSLRDDRAHERWHAF
jgi:hypothetical protein